MKLDHCHRASCVQIIEALTAERDRLAAENAELVQELQNIANADWRKWDELSTPDDYVMWAKSRASAALAKVKEAGE